MKRKSKFYKWNEKTKAYTGSEIAKITGTNIYTVWNRFASKYARFRWGVKLYQMPDKTFRKMVDAKDLGLWAKKYHDYYRRRPANKPE